MAGGCWAGPLPRTRPGRRGSANGCGQVCCGAEAAGRCWTRGLSSQKPGAGGRARPTPSEDLTDPEENKKPNQNPPAAPRFFAKKSWVELGAGRGSRIPRGRLRPPSDPDRGASPRAPAAAPRVGPGEDVEAKRATRPLGTSRLRSSVVNKVSPPPPRWCAS